MQTRMIVAFYANCNILGPENGHHFAGDLKENVYVLILILPKLFLNGFTDDKSEPV